MRGPAALSLFFLHNAHQAATVLPSVAGAALARDAIDVVESADQAFFAGWPPQLVQALRAGPLSKKR